MPLEDVIWSKDFLQETENCILLGLSKQRLSFICEVFFKCYITKIPTVVLCCSFSHSLGWSVVTTMRIYKSSTFTWLFLAQERLIALELYLRLSNSLADVKLLCFCECPFLAGTTYMWASLWGYWFLWLSVSNMQL